MGSNVLKNILSGVLCLALHVSAIAQMDIHPLFITESNGLSDDNINCIFRDHNNFFWIGTSSGLNLIDGSSITVFKNIPGDSSSIGGNEIRCIAEDLSGFLWVGTNNGLNEMNPRVRTLSRISLSENDYRETIIGIAVNKDNDLYVATARGLFFYDPAKKQHRRLEIPGMGIEKSYSNRITSLAFDKAGLLYLTTYDGLWRYDESSGRFTHLISTHTLFTCFTFDLHQNIWIGTWDKGVMRWDAASGKETWYPSDEGKNNVMAIAGIPTASGFDIVANNIVVHADFSAISTSGQADGYLKTAKAIHYDGMDSRLWVGGSNGLELVHTSGNQFRYHKFERAITTQDVSILAWNQHYLIGGRNRSFLKLFDDHLHEVQNFSSLVKSKEIVCLTMEPDGSDRIKCGTTMGIADIDLAGKRVVFHHLNDSTAIPRQLEFVNCIFKDSENSWWIFPWRNGIWMRRPGGLFPEKIFNNFLTSFGLPKRLVISDACEDHKGNIWLSDYDEGIILYNRNTHTFSKPFSGDLGQLFSCSQVIYHKGYCYSFVSNALLVWNTDSIILHRIPLLPLRDKSINSIALDSIGNVWMATQSGMIAYNLQTRKMLHFKVADGLPSDKMNGILYCAPGGEMIFGSPGYLFSFRPENLLMRVQKKPQIKLSQVMVNGHADIFNPTADNYFNHSMSNYVFKWAVTDYTDPLNNHYYYMLTGVDKTWRNAGSSGVAEFANLSPGHYTLLLKGENSNGVAASKILKMRFDILPPFWNTWWFISIVFLLVVIFFYALYRYRLNQLLRVKKLRDNISLNLHDDIGSTLSSISILSEMALHRNTDLESEKMLEEIKENSMVMMDRMDDIVWSINPKNDSLEELLVRIRAFAGKLFEAKEIEYEIKIDENIRHIQLSMQKRQQIYLIMKEAINNMVKHANCTRANICTSYTAPVLNIVISDNGTGFQEYEATRGNGMYSMKKRAVEMKGTLCVDSRINKGTTISLKVKIK